MPRRSLLGAAALALVVAGCGDDGRTLAPAPSTTAVPATVPPTAETASLQLISPDVAEGASLDPRLTCDGAGDAPTLLVTGAPPAAAELGVAVVDVDAAGAVHWVVAGIPPSVEVLDPALLPAGAVVGRTEDGTSGWEPPCPPAGDGPHRYELRLYALPEPLALAADVDGREAVAALEQAALERDVLTATYER